MSGETNLQTLLKTLCPKLSREVYVFTCIESLQQAYSLNPKGLFVEEEGITCIVDIATALNHNLAFDGEFHCITLECHSSLEAVGLTAAFSNALKDVGISANVVAGYYHDHIFVPRQQSVQALAALNALSQTST